MFVGRGRSSYATRTRPKATGLGVCCIYRSCLSRPPPFYVKRVCFFPSNRRPKRGGTADRRTENPRDQRRHEKGPPPPPPEIPHVVYDDDRRHVIVTFGQSLDRVSARGTVGAAGRRVKTVWAESFAAECRRCVRTMLILLTGINRDGGGWGGGGGKR